MAMESNDQLEQLLEKLYVEDSINTSDIIDEEWKKFEKEHFKEECQGKRNTFSFLQVAATFIGVLMLSGIAYATIYYARNHFAGDDSHQGFKQEITQQASTQQQVESLPQDSTAVKPVVYEDTELAKMMEDIAAYYQCEVVFSNQSTKKVRLYFTWDKTMPLEEVVKTFNMFERFHITMETSSSADSIRGKKLVIE